MRRYIDADKLYESMQWNIQHDMYDKPFDYLAEIDCQPTADVRENVKAHWIDMKPTGDDRFMCSRCKWKEKVPTIMGEPIVWDYCPSCGAQMER